MSRTAESDGTPAASSNDRLGFSRLLQDLKSRRRRFRQFAGAIFVFAMTLAGAPRLNEFAVGAGVVLLGMSIRLWASGFVMKNQVLATVGPYARVRHPLYVGNLAICAGFCLASGRWWSWLVALAVLLLFYPTAIQYEDRKLRRLFPDEWDRWAAKTRALLPSATPYLSEHGQDQPRWSLKLSMMRNGEPIHILVGVLCLAYLYSKNLA